MANSNAVIIIWKYVFQMLLKYLEIYIYVQMFLSFIKLTWTLASLNLELEHNFHKWWSFIEYMNAFG